MLQADKTAGTALELARQHKVGTVCFKTFGAGKLLDRIAPRWVATIGAAVGATGFLLCADVKTPIGFYFAYGVLYGLGSSWTGAVVANSSVGKWFVRQRGLAIGISSMGVSFGTITLTPATAFMLEHFSWKTGFLFIGLTLLVPGILIAQLLLRRTIPEAYGLTPDGEPFYADLATMPHLLIAGATGSGKSIGLQSFITSILYRATREQVQFIFIDPKRIELGAYADIPHLKAEVVVEPKKAANALYGYDGEVKLPADQAKVKEAFEKMANRIEAHMKRFYLLSYCTPARKGEHEVRIVDDAGALWFGNTGNSTMVVRIDGSLAAMPRFSPRQSA